ncbi:hypothetical protein AB6802_27505 [Mesorhizobium sp. RCC_202]|uniref:hypothetical protein n=1 Tax=Mesorhizobium sp. RCC_202 TaxID=3239222 RepID=UPI003523FD9F
MIKLPARLADRDRMGAFLMETDDVVLVTAGENMIVSIAREELEFEDRDDDDASWLAALAPLRADLLAGDLRLFYLTWLMAVETDAVEPDAPEPMPGIGPLTDALEAFAEFFGINRNLVQAAAEQGAATVSDDATPEMVRRTIAAMPDTWKTDLLVRTFDDGPHASVELRAMVRARLRPKNATPVTALRTAAELRARADEIRLARERAEAELAAAQRRLQMEAAEKARQIRLEAINSQGESVWDDVENEIRRRNPSGYDKAAALLFDLQALAERHGTVDAFRLRLQSIRERHAGKERFIERLTQLE